MRNQCTIDGCNAYVHGNGLCSAHWNRKRRYGDPLASKPRPVSATRVSRTRPDHPLVGRTGKVRRARLVLFDKLEGRDAPCHWCGLPLRWCVIKIKESPPDSLYADHLNRDTTDDRPENLVPACLPCNSNRHRPGWIRGGGPCSQEGCEAPTRALGLCQRHYLRQYYLRTRNAR